MKRKNKEAIGIVGLGKFGMDLAKRLYLAGKSIICIDKEENKVKKASEFSDYVYVGEDLSKKTFEDIGFGECETIVICIGEHMDTAIFATLNALSLGVEKVFAIATSQDQGLVLEKLGAQVIYPYEDSSEKLAKRILSNNVLDFISLSDDIEIIEVKIPQKYVNVSVLESKIRQEYGINIIALETDDKIETRIDPSYIFKEGDCIVIIGEIKSLRKFEELE